MSSNERSEQLKEAILSDDGNAIAKIVAKGVDLEYEYYWMPPIFAAVLGEKLNAIQALSDAGANLNLLTDRGTPLVYAVDNMHAGNETLELLLQLGADPNRRSNPPLAESPLDRALWRNENPDAAILLIQHGADVFSKNYTGNSALNFAVFFNSDVVLSEITERYGHKAKLAIARSRKDFGLIRSAKDNDLSSVKKWIENRSRLDSMDPHSCTAMFYAAQHGNDKMIRALLRAGASTSLTTSVSRNTPLLRAALHGHSSSVKLLLRSGADLVTEFIPAEHFGHGPDMDAIQFALERGHKDLAAELKTLKKKTEST